MTFEWRATGKNAERVLIVGKTGSGKTELARVLAGGAMPAVFFDVKRLNDPGWSRVMGPAAAAELIAGGLTDGDQLVVQPAIDPDWSDADQLDAIARAVFFRGNCALIVDDVLGLVTTRAPYYLRACMNQGRARGVGFMAITQRVHDIPREMLGGAEHVIAFELNGLEDIERLAREATPEFRAVAELPRYSFAWYDGTTRSFERFRPLQLEPGRAA